MNFLRKYVFKFEILFKFRKKFSLLFNLETAYVCVFFLATGLNKLCNKSAKMDLSCIKCVLEEFWKTNSQNSQQNQFLRYFKYLSQIKNDHQILHLSILHTIKCCYGNCKP